MVMNGDRWRALLADADIHEKASEIARHATRGLVAAMELRALLRAHGGPDAGQAESELEEACEHHEQMLAIAMNRLPKSRKREISRELEGASATASLKKAVS